MSATVCLPGGGMKPRLRWSGTQWLLVDPVAQILAADIKAALQKAGVTQRRIAAICRVSPMTVCHVVYGRSRSRKIEAAISRAVGIPVADLWPRARS